MLDALDARAVVDGAAPTELRAYAAGIRTFRVVGIDPWEPSLALARRNVAEAGLEERIALRCQRCEDLPDRAGFDLIWLPTVFISGAVLALALHRVHEALRPGGWLITILSGRSLDRLERALDALDTTLCGGSPLDEAAFESLLQTAGFAEIRMSLTPSRLFVAAQRDPSG